MGQASNESEGLQHRAHALGGILAEEAAKVAIGRFSLRGDKYRKTNRFADAHARPTWNHAILVAALQVRSLSIFARQLQDAPSFPELVSGKLYSKPAMNCILQNESFHEDSTPDAPKNTNPKTRV